ncbi:MAG: nucleoside phosphorylase [Bacteroidia bacterium]|nr:nucleoside phosphorylase [Bacteroidia bacterium]
MIRTIPASELIINPDGSIYHLNLHPDDLADTVFLVGDPDRVPEVSRYFDAIEVKKQKREFVTHTGRIGNKRFTVLSTGIGTDNIDIVLNELDALIQVDLKTREILKNPLKLNVIRIGTSGALQKEIPVDTVLISEAALGLDNLLWFYALEPDADFREMGKDLGLEFIWPYVMESSMELNERFPSSYLRGLTATCSGFYAPQGRQLRMPISQPDFIQKLSNLDFGGRKVSNFEMETAAIFALSRHFGFNALAVNAIVANRITHQFSKDTHKAVDTTIRAVLEAFS